MTLEPVPEYGHVEMLRCCHTLEYKTTNQGHEGSGLVPPSHAPTTRKLQQNVLIFDDMARSNLGGESTQYRVRRWKSLLVAAVKILLC